jgi:addiction module HigA family antidote
MAKKITPGDAVKEKLNEFHLSVKELAEGLKLTGPATRQILGGNTKISLPLAFRLAKFFGGNAADWFSIQIESDLSALKKDAEFQGILKSIAKAKKPSAREIARRENEAKAKSEAKAKKGRPRKEKDDDGASPKASRTRKPRAADIASDSAPKKARGRPGRAKKEEAGTASIPKTVKVIRKPRGSKGAASPAPIPQEDLNIPAEEAASLTPSLFLEDEGTQDNN